MFRIFHHYISRNLFMLGIAEILILMISINLGTKFMLMEFRPGANIEVLQTPILTLSLLFTVIIFFAMMAMGLYQRELHERVQGMLLRLGTSFVLAFALMEGVFLLFPGIILGNDVYAVALACAFFGIASCRLCYKYANSRSSRRVLVYGAGQKALKIQDLRRNSDRSGVSIVGFVDAGSGINLIAPAKVLKPDSTLVELAIRQGIDEIVVALDDQRNTLPVDEILQCKMHGISIIEDTTFYERELGKITIDSLRPSHVIYADGYPGAAVRDLGKRLFDVVFASLILIVALPIMVLAAAAIIFVSNGRGSVIYRQGRVGRNGATFEVYKFRSMHEDAEANGEARWATTNDNRVTRVGKLLRTTRIDELPQLFNVLRGDMSFVGPRPERSTFVDQLQVVIPYYALRHHVKPGITGWAQIRYPYGASEADAREKLQYDLYYLKNYSMFLDMMILFQTVHVVLSRKGSR